jgi:predicted CoA-binding protein
MGSIDGLDDETIIRVLNETRRIAVVGASPRPTRPSNGVLRFLVQRGYEVTGVNPGIAGSALHGRPVVAGLEDAVPLEMVDIFRNSAHVGPVVDAAIRLRARTIWMQLGVVDERAAERARAQGITVVMDRCPVIEVRRLGL